MDIPVSKVASLARLTLNEEEARTLEGQLDEVLAYVAKLDELELEGVEPTSHAVPLTTPFRDDAPAPPLPREQALANAPAVDGAGQAFAVPKVV